MVYRLPNLISNRFYQHSNKECLDIMAFVIQLVFDQLRSQIDVGKNTTSERKQQRIVIQLLCPPWTT